MRTFALLLSLCICTTALAQRRDGEVGQRRDGKAAQREDGELAPPTQLRKQREKNSESLTATGVYQLTGIDSWKISWIGTLVIAAGEGEEISGYIDWIGSGGQCGREIIEGTFNPKVGKLRFVGKKVLMADNVVRSSYTAQMTPKQDAITNGKWDGYRGQGPSGVWQAKRIQLPKTSR